MRRYEMMLIISDLVEDDAVTALLARVRGLITDKSGTIHDEADWGKRQYAYTINHRTYGHYVVFDFSLGYEDLVEMERQLKLSDDVVRFKTVRPDIRIRKTA